MFYLHLHIILCIYHVYNKAYCTPILPINLNFTLDTLAMDL
jgi:hypothetical protein